MARALVASLTETAATLSLRQWLTAVAVLAVLIALPFFVYPVFLMKVMCFALFACAFNLLLGYTGLLSFGHAAFFGSASYVAAHGLQEALLDVECDRTRPAGADLDPVDAPHRCDLGGRTREEHLVRGVERLARDGLLDDLVAEAGEEPEDADGPADRMSGSLHVRNSRNGQRSGEGATLLNQANGLFPPLNSGFIAQEKC